MTVLIIGFLFLSQALWNPAQGYNDSSPFEESKDVEECHVIFNSYGYINHYMLYAL